MKWQTTAKARALEEDRATGFSKTIIHLVSVACAASKFQKKKKTKTTQKTLLTLTDFFLGGGGGEEWKVVWF